MRFRSVLLVILLVLAFAPALLSAETLVKPETATPIEICPSCKEVRVLLVPDNQSKIKLNEGPNVEAAYFSGAAPRDGEKFKAKWIGEKFPREIKIILDPDETKQAGTYDLYLNLQPDSEPGAERLKIQLIHPAASLETIPKLIINRTYWFIALSSNSLPDLRVTETSKKSGITISGVRPVSNSVIGTRPIGGTLGFPQEQPEIKPGDQVKLNYRLDGGFEPGTATGTMKIDAPQLASPASFDFEVRSHVHWIWIGITIAVGLFISYLIKVKLQQTIELDQARLDAEKLLERIKLEEGRHAEWKLRRPYQDTFDKLTDKAKNGIDPAEINNCKVALDMQWQKALQDLAKRHQDEQDAIDKLHDFVTVYNWLLPPKVIEAIDRARDKQGEVQKLIDRDDLTQASNERKNIIFDLGNDIREVAIEWQTKEQKILMTIQTGPHGIPATIPDLSKDAGNLLASLNKVDANTKLDTAEQINLSLQCVQSERTSVKQFLDGLSLVIQDECEKAKLLIPEPPPAGWSASTFDEAPNAVKLFTTFLETLVDNPDGTELIGQLDKIDKAWTDGLQGQFAAPDASVQAELNARDYIQATMLAVRQKMARGPAAAPVHVAIPTPRIAQFYRITSAAPQVMGSSRIRFQTITMPPPAVPTSVTGKKKLKRDKRIQSVIIGVVLVVAGYGLQLNTFVGTFTDFSTLFFWAFGLDLTIDQVGKIIKKP